MLFCELIRHGKLCPPNPWQGTTLEWHPALNPFTPEPQRGPEPITVHRPPCQYSVSSGEFLPQWAPESVQSSVDNTPNTKPE